MSYISFERIEKYNPYKKTDETYYLIELKNIDITMDNYLNLYIQYENLQKMCFGKKIEIQTQNNTLFSTVINYLLYHDKDMTITNNFEYFESLTYNSDYLSFLNMRSDNIIGTLLYVSLDDEYFELFNVCLSKEYRGLLLSKEILNMSKNKILSSYKSENLTISLYVYLDEKNDWYRLVNIYIKNNFYPDYISSSNIFGNNLIRINGWNLYNEDLKMTFKRNQSITYSVKEYTYAYDMIETLFIEKNKLTKDFDFNIQEFFELYKNLQNNVYKDLQYDYLYDSFSNELFDNKTSLFNMYNVSSLHDYYKIFFNLLDENYDKIFNFLINENGLINFNLTDKFSLIWNNILIKDEKGIISKILINLISDDFLWNSSYLNQQNVNQFETYYNLLTDYLPVYIENKYSNVKIKSEYIITGEIVKSSDFEIMFDVYDSLQLFFSNNFILFEDTNSDNFNIILDTERTKKYFEKIFEIYTMMKKYVNLQDINIFELNIIPLKEMDQSVTIYSNNIISITQRNLIKKTLT